MTRFLFPLTVIATVFILCGVLESQAGNAARRYKMKSGIVEYTISGPQKGTETLYFDDWGMREATHTHVVVEMMGFKQETNTLSILKDGYTYNIDLAKRTGTKTETPLMKELSARAEGEGKDIADIGEEILVRMGGKKVGTEEFLGKKCDVWVIEQMASKIWVYNGITLKSVTNMMGMEISKVATRFEENASIAKGKLDLPPDIKFEDQPNIEDVMKKIRRK